MKIFKTQSEVDAALESSGNLAIDDDVCFLNNIVILGDINAWGIDAQDIKAGDIKAWNIKAGDIKAWNIKAGDINAGNIKAGDIKAGDINAYDINAYDITYCAICVAYKSINCKSWRARRVNHLPPQCLDGKLTVWGEETPKLEVPQKNKQN
jgi:hypothetical protein